MTVRRFPLGFIREKQRYEDLLATHRKFGMNVGLVEGA